MSEVITEPDTTSPELFRYFNRRRCTLVSVRADGAIYTRIVGEDWLLNRPAATSSGELDARIAKTRNYLDQAPVWASRITELPDVDTIARWICDDMAEATDGTDVELDGVSPDGAPSWLLALHLM